MTKVTRNSDGTYSKKLFESEYLRAPEKPFVDRMSELDAEQAAYACSRAAMWDVAHPDPVLLGAEV